MHIIHFGNLERPYRGGPLPCGGRALSISSGISRFTNARCRQWSPEWLDILHDMRYMRPDVHCNMSERAGYCRSEKSLTSTLASPRTSSPLQRTLTVFSCEGSRWK